MNRWGRRALRCLAGLVVVWLLVAVALAAGAAVVARGAAADLSALRATHDVADLVRGEALADLVAVRGDFARAERWSGSPLLAPARHLPVVGRQLRSLQALSGAGETVLDVAVDATGTVEDLSGGAIDAGGRVEAVQRLGDVASDSRARLSALSLGPAVALVAPLASARAELAAEVDEAVAGLRTAEDVTSGLAALLQGSEYLVLAANNAEMQAGWGMPLSIGLLRVDDGELRLDGMEPASELRVPAGAVDPAGDLAESWSFNRPTEDFRNLALTPHFPQAAAAAAAMWAALGRGEVDGVLAIDPFALQAILAATGPVVVDGERIGSDEVIPFVLHDQYVGQGDGVAGIEARQERQAAIAEAAVGAATGSEVDLVALAMGLGEVSRRRHVMVWSAEDAQQAAWEAAGVDGTLAPNSLLVSAVNRGGNKLDWFIDTRASMTSEAVGERLEVTLEVTLGNRTPEGEPVYVAGPYVDGRGDSPVDAAGDWVGYLAVHLPATARDGRIDGATLLAAGPSGANRLVAARIAVPRGTTSTTTVRFSLPRSGAAISVEPSARVHPIEWDVAGQHWFDDIGRRRVVLGR